MPLEILHDAIEREARIAEDEKLWAALRKEIADRIAADNELWAALRQEIADRIAGDDALWAALRQEIQDRKDGDTAIWNKINNLTFDDIKGMLPGTRVYAY